MPIQKKIDQKSSAHSLSANLNNSKASITHNHGGINDSVVHSLIESQKEQIIFLQDRNKELTAEILIYRRTIDTTLSYLTNSCKECADLHKGAHKKIEQLECFKLLKRKQTRSK
jgi:hypothetical protein